MEIPISLKLRRGMHKQIAYAQDLIVEDLYRVFPTAVLHGGTAIWRCYKGNRFSEDIDIYIKRDIAKIEQLFVDLKRRGFIILKKRLKENSLYSILEFSRIEVRLEAIFKSSRFILKEYETVDGMLINIYTLSSENLIKEKVEAYLRRYFIRDLYDIFFLLRYVKANKEIEGHLLKLLKNFKEPEDENVLKTLIITGIVPTSKQMIDYIKKWVK